MTTEYGFKWGPMTVERCISDPKLGYLLTVSAGGKTLELVCTPTGKKLRVQSEHPTPPTP